jgi:competence ComEA-like helix-hairpin-helix protein
MRPAVVSILVLLAATPRAHAGKAVDGVVNLNTAPVEVLGLLPGIGPAKAADIAAYRKKRPFRTVDELVRIKGIGRKMVRRLRVHLAVAGPTTATGVIGGRGEVVVPPAPAPRPPPPPSRVACTPCAKPPIGRTRPPRQLPDTWLTRSVCLRAR